MNRWTFLALSLATTTGLCVLAASPARAAPWLESATDRPGGDYRTFDIASDSPDRCAAACLAEVQCAAFTFAAPGVVAPAGRCSLKSTAPSPTPNQGRASGLKSNLKSSAVRTSAMFEVGQDRPGQEYRTLDFPENNPELCAAACMAEDQCRSFTFAKPGLVAPAARCFLKAALPGVTPNPGYVSGLKPLLLASTVPVASPPPTPVDVNVNPAITLVGLGMTDLKPILGESCLLGIRKTICTLEGECVDKPHIDSGANRANKLIGLGPMVFGRGINLFNRTAGLKNGNRSVWVRIGANDCRVQEGAYSDKDLKLGQKY